MAPVLSLHRVTILAWGPAFLLGALYWLCLGCRRDYLGHYAAGYGATLAAVCAVQSRITVERYASVAQWLTVSGTVLCIGLGAIAEATVFRLARFDEIDLGNQSLGAVLAGLVLWHLARSEKPRDAVYLNCLLSGLAYLLLGTYFALT